MFDGSIDTRFDDRNSGTAGHYYKIIPLAIAHDAWKMTSRSFELVYEALGKLGYLFRDAGNNHEKVVVSLDKPISPKHLKRLEGAFSITVDDGAELHFC